MFDAHRHRSRAGLVATATAALVLTGLAHGTAGTGSAAPAGQAEADPGLTLAAGTVVAARKTKRRLHKRPWVVVHRSGRAATSGRPVYRATALVRTNKRSTRTKFRVTQTVNGHLAAARSTSVRVGHSSWRKVNLSLAASPKASTVLVMVKRRRGLQVSGIRVARVTRTASVVVAPPSTPPPVPTGWRLDMSEDFDSLSPSRWNIKNNTYASNEDSYLLARNTSVRGGLLRIQGKLEKAGGRNYTSGYVDTIGKYSVPKYFRAEVRAKVPFEQGLWAAPLWFRPTTGGVGEIDIVETLGNERAKPTFHQTIHTEYGSSHKQASVTKPYTMVGNRSATDWHTYTIEKVPGRTTMWVDGVRTADFTPQNPSWYNAYYEKNLRWNLRVNMQIGGTWGGLPNSSTNWSPDKSAMQLDYIRTWVPN